MISNMLPKEVMESDTINMCKRHLDKYFNRQGIGGYGTTNHHLSLLIASHLVPGGATSCSLPKGAGGITQVHPPTNLCSPCPMSPMTPFHVRQAFREIPHPMSLLVILAARQKGKRVELRMFFQSEGVWNLSTLPVSGKSRDSHNI